jgi:4a-hydroxytetrahydrobiopterin dehydratase
MELFQKERDMAKSSLLSRKSKALAARTPALSEKRAQGLLAQVHGWKIVAGELTRSFKFENYYEAVAFVNATAWVSHAQDHHPDIALGYNTVVMRYSTHSVGGLSENDFICAAHINVLVDKR